MVVKDKFFNKVYFKGNCKFQSIIFFMYVKILVNKYKDYFKVVFIKYFLDKLKRG